MFKKFGFIVALLAAVAVAPVAFGQSAKDRRDAIRTKQLEDQKACEAGDKSRCPLPSLPPLQWTGDQYEYRNVIIPNLTIGYHTNELNEMGREGWEVVDTTRSTGANAYLLKRKLPADKVQPVVIKGPRPGEKG
jgi:hypothetical protein